MRGTRYTAEFKAEAIKQITERGRGVVEVSKRLGVSDKSLYAWIKQSQQDDLPNAKNLVALKLELQRIKAEIKPGQVIPVGNVQSTYCKWICCRAYTLITIF